MWCLSAIEFACGFEETHNVWKTDRDEQRKTEKKRQELKKEKNHPTSKYM